MGLFDFLKQGIPDIINTLIKSAGSIAKVVTAVHGALSQQSGTKDTLEAIMATNPYLAAGQSALPTLKDYLKTAESTLSDLADRHARRPDNPSGTTCTDIHIAGCWPKPALIQGGNAPPEIAADINKVLSLEGLPTSVGEKDSAVDLGAQLAQQMFSGAPQSLSIGGSISAFHSTGEICVDALEKHGIRFHGTHIFYRIPLGQDGSNDEAWHSHTKLWVVTDDRYKMRMIQRMQNLRIQPSKLGLKDENGSYNMTTVTAKWTGNINVDKIMSDALKYMTQSDSDFEFVEPSVNNGNEYTYQFRTKTRIGPAAVKNALAQAINEMTKQTLHDTVLLPVQPEINIDHNLTFVG